MNEIDKWFEKNGKIFDDVDREITDTSLITKSFLNKEDWCNFIRETVSKNNCGYMETIIDYSESNGIEIEVLSKLIDDNLKESIRLEAEENNMMKPLGRLDF